VKDTSKKVDSMAGDWDIPFGNLHNIEDICETGRGEMVRQFWKGLVGVLASRTSLELVFIGFLSAVGAFRPSHGYGVQKVTWKWPPDSAWDRVARVTCWERRTITTRILCDFVSHGSLKTPGSWKRTGVPPKAHM
jgi:hypothetical protein